MISFRIRKASRRDLIGGKKLAGNTNKEGMIPTHFRCPISLDLMKDPVTLCTGITYDRQSIDTWLDAGNHTCPVTNQPLKSLEQIPNHTIRRMIQDWCVENSSYGIERIPTPRIPVTSAKVSEILLGISAAARRRDYTTCRELVKKINNLSKESERNKRCFIANGSNRVLSAAFDAFATVSSENYAVGLEEILSILTWMLPLDVESRLYLGSDASLRFMLWILTSGNLTGRRNAVLALKELVTSDRRHVDTLVEINGFIEALVKIIKEPICPTTTKASMVTIFYMVSSPGSSSTSYTSNQKTRTRFVELGLVSLLLEMLVDSEKSISEKALGVLDGICSCEEGREKAYSNALTMPVLVKKIFRVSELATEFAISILWKLCKNYKGEEGGILVEALQVGAFQKVLLLLQVGCGDRTKEKATDLLKLLNNYRGRGECIESMDFKQLKRPF
ncbi:U-box domain-containing protein 20-like [Tasmannia lanceolata]|uniref:U-box domain-containing protein 20-like n=1 Tax=Tasmannia lanceolata TaxID=3420 RepID=UPI0040647349